MKKTILLLFILPFCFSAQDVAPNKEFKKHFKDMQEQGKTTNDNIRRTNTLLSNLIKRTIENTEEITSLKEKNKSLLAVNIIFSSLIFSSLFIRLCSLVLFRL